MVVNLSLSPANNDSITTPREEKHKSPPSFTLFIRNPLLSTEKCSPFSQKIHNPNAVGELMPVYLSDLKNIILEMLDGDILLYSQGDEETRKLSPKQRQGATIFGIKLKDLVHSVGSAEAAFLANLILRGEEKDVEDALFLVKKNPDLLRSQCIATDPLKRRVLGTPLQIAAMAGDVNLITSKTEEKNRGLVERLKAAASLSDEEVRDQLEEVLTSQEAIAENEKRTEHILGAIKTFGRRIVDAQEQYWVNTKYIPCIPICEREFREHMALEQRLYDLLGRLKSQVECLKNK